MMNDIKDLFSIDEKIESINIERKQLSIELDENDKLKRLITEQNTYYTQIVDDIIENINDLSDVDTLKEKYGDLEILDLIESKIIEKLAVDSNVKELKQIEDEIDQLKQVELSELSYEKLAIVHSKIEAVLSEGHLLKDDTIVKAVLDSFDQTLLNPFCQQESDTFNQVLLDSKWDNNKFLLSDTTSITSLRAKSSHLYRLVSLYLHQDNKQYWNFKSLATNFQVRFTYHFHKSTSNDIAIYFKFLNDYLDANLYKCINIFKDDSVGLTKELLHEEFVNHILQPMRERINNTLSQDNLKSLITLISQIISTDKNLVETYHYHGNGLVSLISDEFWDAWINYEIKTVVNQFNLITNNSKELIKSGKNFIKILDKVYDYFQPFYDLNYEPLLKYKLRTCSEIYLDLSSKYLHYVLTTDSLQEKHPKEDELYQTIMKLELLNSVYNKINELANMSIFIKLTETVNQNESKEYLSVFQDVLNRYKRDMSTDLQNSIIHRTQKLLKESLQTYFKIGMWILNEISDDGARSEITNTINILKRIITRLESVEISNDLLFNIKNELLNIMINYFIESILKLNKFNKMGLNQLEIDFQSVKESLQIPYEFQNSHELGFHEILKIIDLKYNENFVHFTDSSYIKRGDFIDVKTKLDITQLSDNEIQDALFRIAYGNII